MQISNCLSFPLLKPGCKSHQFPECRRILKTAAFFEVRKSQGMFGRAGGASCRSTTFHQQRHSRLSGLAGAWHSEPGQAQQSRGPKGFVPIQVRCTFQHVAEDETCRAASELGKRIAGFPGCSAARRNIFLSLGLMPLPKMCNALFASAMLYI